MAASEQGSVTAADAVAPPPATDGEAVWADAPKKRRRWPWIVAPIVVVAAGAGVASTFFIAPNVSAAGTDVGWRTTEGATEAIAAQLAKTSVTLDMASGPVTLSAADLGAQADAKALATQAKEQYPLWNVTAWGGENLFASVTVDEKTADAALREALPDAYVAPTDATVTFDGASYVVTPSAEGSGVPADVAVDALKQAVAAGETSVTVQVTPEVLAPALTTETAATAAASLNAVVANAGFYIGTDRTVPVDAPTAASWLSYTIAPDGSVAITADETKIASVIPGLAAHVDVAPVNGVTYTTTSGNTLPQAPGGAAVPAPGRKLGDTSTLAATFAANFSQGNGGVELPVETVAPQETRLVKRIEVDLSEQRIYLWEGDQVVKTFPTSSGLPGDATPTHTGDFTIGGRLRSQDMGCGSDRFDYCVRDVPNVMYFNGDEAFHGAPWNTNIGVPASHGCLNMWPGDAAWLWDWTPTGTEVSVHN